MAGDYICPEKGAVVIGIYGKYLLKKDIGRGGNGTVYDIEIMEGGDFPYSKRGYVIKVLTVRKKDEDEAKKRKLRFQKEIQIVLSLQNQITGIIPIYDTSIYNEDTTDLLWYLMPKAIPYNNIKMSFSAEQKLAQMFQLGKSIMQLHNLGYAHRDKKPANLLVFEGHLCLSDFGLIWDVNDTDEHITEVNDRLGPQTIRPLELQLVETVVGVDYRKSDVYLFAKTVWMILLCNNNGFSDEYSRSRNDVYIEKKQLEVETTEPLQCLMEKSTKYNYWERIDMEGCLRFIDDQLKVIRGNIPEQTLIKWKYDEQIKRLNETVHPDEKICKDPSEIIKILDAMAETADLVFVEEGKEYSRLPFIRARYVENNLYDIDIQNVYYLGRRKTIEFAIDGISLKRDASCEIHSNTYRFDMKPIPTFYNVDAALKCTDRFVRINTKCKIRMICLGSTE